MLFCVVVLEYFISEKVKSANIATTQTLGYLI